MNQPLEDISDQVVRCNRCTRLRKYCQEVAKTKKRAFSHEEYWGKPIPGFGDPKARLMIVGLAPAAHGANRTGRIFTGDRSGEWLYRALFQFGFSNQPSSLNSKDDLKLYDAYISCVVRCAPPDNKPNPIEKKNCLPYLVSEMLALKQVKVWIALGHIALEGLWPILTPDSKKPAFGHGNKIELADGKWLLMSYHPSQQNTFTGRLTQPMFHSVFEEAKNILKGLK